MQRRVCYSRFERDLGAVVLAAATHYPIVTVTGPRPSAKTTLCRVLFPDRPHVSLEPLDVSERAASDPRGFLAALEAGELRRLPGPPEELFPTLLAGAFRRIHDRGIPSGGWLADHVATYAQKDVRQLLDVGDLQILAILLRLCAGRIERRRVVVVAQNPGLAHLAGVRPGET